MARHLFAALVAGLHSPTLGIETWRFPTDINPDLASIRAERNDHQSYFANLRAQRHQADKVEKRAGAEDDEVITEPQTVPASTKSGTATAKRVSKEKKSTQKSAKKNKKNEASKTTEAKSTEKSASKEAVKEPEHAGRLFATAMFGTVVILMLIVGLSLSKDKVIPTYTITAADNVVAVFLAVLCFQAYDGFLDEMIPVPGHKVIVAWLHAALVLLLAYIVSFRLRESRESLAIFAASAAHYGSFASMHAATEMLHAHFSNELIMCIIGFVVILALIMVMFYLAEMGRKKLGEHEEWQDRIDDVANDFGAMALAVCWSLLVRALIAGKYHHVSTGETQPEHTADQRMMMLAYGIVLVPVAAFVVNALSKVQSRLTEEDYWKKRGIMLTISFFCMSVAWAFLLWGQWQFESSAGDSGPEIISKVSFAMAATLVTAAGIIALAYHRRRFGASGQHVRKVALTALSLLVGWSWEESFDAAVEDIADESANPMFLKIAVSMGLIAVMLPVYAMYLKPYALEKQEALEKDED